MRRIRKPSGGHLVAQHAKDGGGFLDDVLACVRGAEHQGEPAVDEPDDGELREDETCPGREKRANMMPVITASIMRPTKISHHGDHMAVQGLGVHVPVAHRRQRLDAEEKRAEETGRAQIGDAAGHGIVKTAEDQVEDQEEGDDGGEKPRSSSPS